MAEEERRQKNKDLKIKKRDYKGYDDDEFVEGNEGIKRAVLAKYDEDIDGPKEIVRSTLCFCFVIVLRLLCSAAGFPPGCVRYYKADGAKNERANHGIR
jgi:hypothetical protein